MVPQEPGKPKAAAFILFVPMIIHHCLSPEFFQSIILLLNTPPPCFLSPLLTLNIPLKETQRSRTALEHGLVSICHWHKRQRRRRKMLKEVAVRHKFKRFFLAFFSSLKLLLSVSILHYFFRVIGRIWMRFKRSCDEMSCYSSKYKLYICTPHSKK